MKDWCDTHTELHSFGPWQIVQVQKQRVEHKELRVDTTPTLGSIKTYENVVLTDTELVSARICGRCGLRETV